MKELKAEVNRLISENSDLRKKLILFGVISFTTDELSTFRCRYERLLRSGYKEYFKNCNFYYSKDENAL